jgi:hypothetical protein
MRSYCRWRRYGLRGQDCEVDGGYFGGYVKPANLKADRVDRCFGDNQSGKRKTVVVICECNGNSLPPVFHSEGAALSFMKARVAKGTVVHEAGAWNDLHSRY